MSCKQYILSSFLFILCLINAQAKEINLHLPIVNESPQQHLFYHELITTALNDIGYKVNVTTELLPHRRAINYLETGKVSLFWMFHSKQRDKEYIPIHINLTNNLVGRRLLFIKKSEQHLYDQVNNLNDFRQLKLVGGMGKNWYDVQVWQLNNLLYKEKEGNWSTIFTRMSIDTGINYFSRGINEIIVESRQHPELDIEKRLALIIDRDFRFYLSKKGSKAVSQYKEVISEALQIAENTGLINKLVKKYWAKDLEQLNFDDRIDIHLLTPK